MFRHYIELTQGVEKVNERNISHHYTALYLWYNTSSFIFSFINCYLHIINESCKRNGIILCDFYSVPFFSICLTCITHKSLHFLKDNSVLLFFSTVPPSFFGHLDCCLNGISITDTVYFYTVANKTNIRYKTNVLTISFVSLLMYFNWKPTIIIYTLL